MTTSARGLWPYAILLALGAGWGITVPLSKIAVSQGYRPFGLILWQMVISATVLGTLMAATRRQLPRGRAWGICLVISLIGTLLPNSASYLAARHLPAGVLSILLSTVPMLAFPIALALRTDRFGVGRLFGLCCGLAGVALIALPGSSLPSTGMAAWLPVALIAPAFYALESNVVAKWGTQGLDPVQLLFGASLLGVPIAAVLAVGSGQFIDPRPPWGAPDFALMASASLSSLVYAGYVWLIGKAGSVFAAQVSYLVTGAGVVWAMLLLGERYSSWIWGALALMLCGLALVQPRRPDGACASPPGGGASAESA